MFYRQMLPNIQLIRIKYFIEQKKRSSLEIKCRIARIEVDYTFMKFDFMTGGLEIKIAIHAELTIFLAVILFL